MRSKNGKRQVGGEEGVEVEVEVGNEGRCSAAGLPEDGGRAVSTAIPSQASVQSRRCMAVSECMQLWSFFTEVIIYVIRTLKIELNAHCRPSYTACATQ